jgi:SET family sugar efflux transporter-like MFS transporter
LIALPVYRAFILAAVLVAFRDAMAEPYMVLFAVERAHMAPLALGAFLTVRAIGAISFSMAFGLWLDRSPSLMPLCIALLLGAAGFALLASTSDHRLLLLVAGLPLAAGGAAFPQLFALARSHLDRLAAGVAGRGIAVLRATFSAAWAIGPLLGAIIVEAYDFRGVFRVSATCGLVAFAAIVWSRVQAPGHRTRGLDTDVTQLTNRGIAVSAGGFVLYFMALVMGSVALPIVVTHDLQGVTRDVGVIAGVCAFLEVPVMIAVAMRPALVGGFGGLVAGFVTMALYFLAAAWAPSVETMIAAQVLRAIGIGLVTCIGIGYMQDLMPSRIGAAAALFTITNQVGSLVAGLAAGEWAQRLGFRSLFWACAIETGLGLILICLGAKPVKPGTTAA